MATYIFEQDISRETCLRYPNSYGAGQVNAYFTFSVFWKWLLLAIWHGSLAFWVPILGLADPMDDTGLNSGLFLISTISFTLIIFIVTLKLLNESLYWSYLNM
jgi:succinate-acetate transporter protein